jgi:aminopeptidase N
VLRQNEAKARFQFEQVKPMLDCFQSKFGNYPFAEDSYKLVETAYLGMEHQSAVAYGNKYQNGYLGSDLSGTGHGLLFDFIIIHESGHEWFGNSITSKDIADMWIHEGFTCYSESVYLECEFGNENAQQYINGLRRNIRNDKPIIGKYGVGNEGSSDMYYKGALMINTIRSVIDNDEKWWTMLLKFATTLKHKIIDTKTVVDFFNEESGFNLTPIFDQYLRHTDIPTFEYRFRKKSLEFRWKADVTNFHMPIDLMVNGKKTRVYPNTTWQKLNIKSANPADVEVLKNQFYVNTLNVKKAN